MSFDKSVNLVLKAEGGYSNNPNDPGGETKFGISKRAYPTLDIKNLTLDQAKIIYKRDYWDKIKGDQLPNDVSTVCFDMAVNMGISQAVKLLQKALDVVQDGVIGPNTISAANKANPDSLCQKLTLERIMFYSALKNFTTFGRGWVNRSLDVLMEATS